MIKNQNRCNKKNYIPAYYILSLKDKLNRIDNFNTILQRAPIGIDSNKT